MLLYQGLRRAATSVLIQMQTGKIALASYLGTFGAMESTECSCGRGRQDVRHIFLHCTNQAGPRARHLTQGSRRELDYQAHLTRPDLAPKAVRFMLETGLLGQFRTQAATYRVTVSSKPAGLRGPGNSGGIKRCTGYSAREKAYYMAYRWAMYL